MSTERLDKWVNGAPNIIMDGGGGFDFWFKGAPIVAPAAPFQQDIEIGQGISECSILVRTLVAGDQTILIRRR